MFENSSNPILTAFEADYIAYGRPSGLADMYLAVLEGGPDEAALDPETASIIADAIVPDNYGEALRIRGLENDAIKALREVINGRMGSDLQHLVDGE